MHNGFGIYQGILETLRGGIWVDDKEGNFLKKVIETGRNTLEEMIEDLGVTHPRVLKMSRMLDELILLAMTNGSGGVN